MSYHRAFTNLIAAEWVKLRRGPAPVVAIVLPLMVVCFPLLSIWGDRSRPAAPLLIASFHNSVLFLWAAFVLPSIVALEAGFITAVEHRDHQWKHLHAMPLPRWWVLGAKLLVLEAIMIACSVLLWVLAILASGMMLRVRGADAATATLPLASFASLASTIGLLAVTTTAIAPLHLWYASVSRHAAIPPVIAIFAVFLCIANNSGGWTRVIPWGFGLQVIGGKHIGSIMAGSLIFGAVCFLVSVWHHQVRDVPS